MQFILQCECEKFEKGLHIVAPMLNAQFAGEGLLLEVRRNDSLTVCYDGKTCKIGADSVVQVIRAFGILIEKLKTKTIFTKTETPVFENLAASFDMSRGGVLTVSAMEIMLCRMAVMGYTEVMMYTEEVYEIDGYPFFGYLRGKYSKDELKHLDEYASNLGIELVPCIQTLGHLERFLHWASSAHLRDTNDVLIVGNEKTYELIEEMFKSTRECYKTNKIHVGMDEAMSLGLGGYLRDNGYTDAFSIMQQHIEKVCKIAEKYGFKPMMWSDMYFRCASKTHDYYEDDISIPQNIIDSAPKNMELVYWDYYHADKAFYDHYISLHKKFDAKIWFAGGMWTWLGPAIDYDVFFKNTIPALRSCIDNNISHVIITAWGDDGAECNVLTTLLGLQVYAEYCYTGNYDENYVNARFFACTGANANAMRRISAFNKTPLLAPESDLPNGAKFLLYQDPLLGLYDLDVEGLGFANQYKILAEEFDAYAKTEKQYTQLYKFYACLAKVLAHKAELGINLYRAYEKGDKDTLRLFAEDALNGANACHGLKQAWEEMWFTTNKAFGFEIIDGRICAVEGRLRHCAKRVTDYCNGTINEIEELAEKRLYLLRKENTNILNGVYFCKDIVSSAKAF